MATVEKGLSGLENLALIPGTVGAAPVQNIGAYGVELADCLVSVSGWDCVAKNWRTLTTAECELGYRDSIFKHALAGRFIITELCLSLSTSPQNSIAYQPLAEALAGQIAPSPADVAAAVIAIRQSKLPNPAELANAGSFFKNPVISQAHYDELTQHYPQLPCYPVDAQHCKVPAAWLLDNAGWKGYRGERVGVHEKQALVLVNFNGSGDDILALAARIQSDIAARFGIELEIEPQQLGCLAQGAGGG
jgi:UDP-N-acetylmuramate dehydrogenase